uniref:hypothetical protein n=1 Tax=Streptomyces europaeiscabiei TaxID=146819 RepID=UPI0018FE35DE
MRGGVRLLLDALLFDTLVADALVADALVVLLARGVTGTGRVTRTGVTGTGHGAFLLTRTG